MKTITILLLLVLQIEAKEISNARLESLTKLEIVEPFKNSLTTESFYKGRTIIHYWASWCGSCVVELPELWNFLKSHSDKLSNVYIVSLDDDPKLYKVFFKKITLPTIKAENILTLMDPNKVLSSYNIRMVPETYIYEDGILIRKIVGPTKWQDESLQKFLIGDIK